MVNGLPLDPKIRPLESNLNFPGDLTVPKGSYFVLYGISTNRTFDANWFLVRQGDILGKLAFRYFPIPEVL
jgi:hypothetical protein